MQIIKKTVEKVKLGTPVQDDSLVMFPLLHPEVAAKDYLTLDEALAAGSASVTEVSQAGSVPELLFCNRGDKAVFLLDGEELVGAKQNRILNISILAPAHKDIVIPVSCVEAGRWRHARPDFTTAPRTQFAESRAKRSAQVSESMARSGERRSNQGEVWADISAKMAFMGSRSPTQAVESLLADHEGRLQKFVDKMQPTPEQIGAVFCLGGRVVGAELFDHHETCVALLPKIVRSYALDAIDPRNAANDTLEKGAVEQFLQHVAVAAIHEAPAVGEGTDIRFDVTSGVAGGALLARQRVVHLVAFAMSGATIRSSDRVHRHHRF